MTMLRGQGYMQWPNYRKFVKYGTIARQKPYGRSGVPCQSCFVALHIMFIALLFKQFKPPNEYLSLICSCWFSFNLSVVS